MRKRVQSKQSQLRVQPGDNNRASGNAQRFEYSLDGMLQDRLPSPEAARLVNDEKMGYAISTIHSLKPATAAMVCESLYKDADNTGLPDDNRYVGPRVREICERLIKPKF